MQEYYHHPQINLNTQHVIQKWHVNNQQHCMQTICKSATQSEPKLHSNIQLLKVLPLSPLDEAA